MKKVKTRKRHTCEVCGVFIEEGTNAYAVNNDESWMCGTGATMMPRTYRHKKCRNKKFHIDGMAWK